MPKPIYAHILDKRYKSIDIDDYEDLKISQILHKKKNLILCYLFLKKNN